MNRPQQVTRSTSDAAQAPIYRRLSDEEPFSWSTTIQTSGPPDTFAEYPQFATYLAPGESGTLVHDLPRHSSNGAEGFYEDTAPHVRLKIPRDGVYAISYQVAAGSWVLPPPLRAIDDGPPPAPAPVGTLAVSVLDGLWYPQAHVIVTFTGEYNHTDAIYYSRVGVPLYEGDGVGMQAANDTDCTLLLIVEHLEATYQCPLGYVYPWKIEV